MRSVFIIKKTDTLRYAIFHEIFEIDIFLYGQKHDTLRNVTFLYTKGQTLRKKQSNLRNVFIYKKLDALHYAIFIKFLKLAKGGAFLYAKKCTLRYIFIF